MNAWEFLDKHMLGVGTVIVLVVAFWPSIKFNWRRDCKACEARAKAGADE